MSNEECRELFLQLTNCERLESKIQSLSDDEIRGLHQWLCDRGHTSGVPLMIRGLLEVEACRRFMEGGHE